MFPAYTCESPFSNPFNHVPYDVLKEIFIRCLPEDRLDEAHIQPNINIAPILLCHVCSSWRTVVLASASLWTHLYIRLPIVWDDDWISRGCDPGVRDSAALKRDVEFMKWWRINQGFNAPFLRINPHRKSWRRSPLHVDEAYLPPEVADFLFQYMSSACYLDVGRFYTYLIQQGTKRGLSVVTPKLHTLVSHSVRFDECSDYDDEYFDNTPVQPSQIPPTLRRLSIRHEKITLGKRTKDLNHWSTLTHLSLNDVQLSLTTWFSIIRVLTDLQWGYFAVLFMVPMNHPPPPKVSLPSLVILSVCCGYCAEFPLSMLFQNLQLPALRSLSLSSSADSWANSGAAIEIHNVLKSAPTITKLALGASDSGFLCSSDESGIPTAIDDNVPPLSMDAPYLSHLQIGLQYMHYSDLNALAGRFVKNLFLSKRWLDLGNPANTIQAVTIVIQAMAWDVDAEFENILKVLLMWNIKKYIKKAINISFEVVSEGQHGIDFAKVVWRTWDSVV